MDQVQTSDDNDTLPYTSVVHLLRSRQYITRRMSNRLDMLSNFATIETPSNSLVTRFGIIVGNNEDPLDWFSYPTSDPIEPEILESRIDKKKIFQTILKYKKFHDLVYFYDKGDLTSIKNWEKHHTISFKNKSILRKTCLLAASLYLVAIL